MADVRLDDGYIRLANTLATAIALAPWDSAAQPRLVMALIRTTFGMNRKEADIGMAQWRAMTGMHDRQVRRAKESLQKAGVITLVRDFDARSRTPQRWQLNKDYETWGPYAVSVDAVQAAEDHAPTR
jgi:phage replication O-like protein O